LCIGGIVVWATDVAQEFITTPVSNGSQTILSLALLEALATIAKGWRKLALMMFPDTAGTHSLTRGTDGSFEPGIDMPKI